MNPINHKLTISEKIGYALGDGAANIAWRGVSTTISTNLLPKKATMISVVASKIIPCG